MPLIDSGPHFNRSSHASCITSHWRCSMVNIRSFSSSSIPHGCVPDSVICCSDSEATVNITQQQSFSHSKTLFPGQPELPTTTKPPSHPAPAAGKGDMGERRQQKVKKGWFIVDCARVRQSQCFAATAQLVLCLIAAAFGVKVEDLSSYLYIYFIYPDSLSFCGVYAVK